MKNNPLIDVTVILMCILAVIALGHYFEAKKQKESLQQNEKRVELKVDKKSFEYLSKRTE